MQMRFSAVALLVLLGLPLGGCGDDTTSTPSHDMTASAQDLAASENCFSVAMCALKCTSQSCVNTCAASGTAQAKTKFQALFACGFAHCLAGGSSADGGAAEVDAGAAACASTSDASPTCTACVAAQAQN